MINDHWRHHSILLAVAMIGSNCGGAVPGGSSGVPGSPSAASWGIVPYWNNPPHAPIHPPRAEYLDIYWSDLRPTSNSLLDVTSVRRALEKRLGRPLPSSGSKIAVRFKATGDAKDGPLPSWFEPGWRAEAKCETEERQQLPAWIDPAQIQAHAEIVASLALALDEHPGIAWIEPGSYGFWGEGHLDGSPSECVPSISTREALVRPWIESFRRAPLSITMDWIRTKDDPEHRLRALWSRAASIGLRFDCLGFWHDEFAAVVEGIASTHSAVWSGPWGGEFCFSEAGAQWAMGSDTVADIAKLRSEAPPEVSKMNNTQRRDRVLGVVRDCGWSYLAGAGSSLLEQSSGNAGEALEAAMGAGTRDLGKCAKAAKLGNP